MEHVQEHFQKIIAGVLHTLFGRTGMVMEIEGDLLQKGVAVELTSVVGREALNVDQPLRGAAAGAQGPAGDGVRGAA